MYRQTDGFVLFVDAPPQNTIRFMPSHACPRVFRGLVPMLFGGLSPCNVEAEIGTKFSGFQMMIATSTHAY